MKKLWNAVLDENLERMMKEEIDRRVLDEFFEYLVGRDEPEDYIKLSNRLKNVGDKHAIREAVFGLIGAFINAGEVVITAETTVGDGDEAVSTEQTATDIFLADDGWIMMCFGDNKKASFSGLILDFKFKDEDELE